MLQFQVVPSSNHWCETEIFSKKKTQIRDDVIEGRGYKNAVRKMLIRDDVTEGAGLQKRTKKNVDTGNYNDVIGTG